MKPSTKYRASSSLTSLFQVLCSLLALLVIAETAVMFILPLLHLHGHPVVENFADAFMLAILCAPFIWMLISGRKQAEEELAASEDSLRLIYNSVYDAIFIHDLNGDILDVNDKMLEMYGVTRDQALTLYIKEDYSSRNNSQEELRSLWKKARAGENQFFEWKARRPEDGSQFDVEVSLRKISMKGQDAILATVRDVTARKHAEQELRESQTKLITQHEVLLDTHLQLEKKSLDLGIAYANLKAAQSQMLQKEKMASIGLLAAGVAHEINNPLGFISSNLVTLGKFTERLVGFINAQSEILKSPDLAEKSAELEEQRHKIKLDYIINDVTPLLEESLDGVERVKKIVQNLKSFSRVDDTERTRVDLNECLDSTINIAWNEIKYVATLKKEYGEIPPLLCYPQQLNQVFMNLLVNAAHAIESHGEIIVRTWGDEDHAWVAISDTGTGIPEEIKARIFEPFFTTKEVGKGTGLGLSISYDIVKKHGGEILMKSEGGKGTTFTLKLPMARE